MKTRRVTSRIVLTFAVLVSAACACAPTSTPAPTVQPNVIPTELPQLTTAKYLELAIDSLADSKDGLALAYLDQALASQPDWTDGHLYRGIVLAASRQSDEAMSDFNRVITQQPDRADAYYLRAWAQYAFASQQDLARARAGALTDISKTLELSPTLADARALQAFLDFSDAAQLFQSDRTKATEQMLAAQSVLKAARDTEPGAGDAFLMITDYLVPQVLAANKQDLKPQLEEAHTEQQQAPDDFAPYFKGGVIHLLLVPEGHFPLRPDAAPDLIKAMELGHARVQELATPAASPLEVSRLVSLRGNLSIPFSIMDSSGYSGMPESYAKDPNYPKFVEIGQTYGEDRELFLDLFWDRPLVFSVDVSPDGKTIASLSNNAPTYLTLWDASIGKKLREINFEDAGLIAPRGSVDFSPDGKQILVAYHDPKVRLIDAQTGKNIQTLVHPDAVDIASFSPDGNHVLTVDFPDRYSTGVIRIWDTKTGKETMKLDPESGTIVMSAVFSPDGQRVIGGGDPVQVWEAATGKRVSSYPGYNLVWEAQPGKDVPLFPAPSDASGYYLSIVNLLQVSADGSLIALPGSNPRIVDAKTGEVVQKLTGHRDGVRAMAFSPDGSRVATASWDGTARIWDVKSGVQRVQTGHIGSVASVAFSPDGRQLITGGSDGAVRVWDTETGQELWNALAVPPLL